MLPGNPFGVVHLHVPEQVEGGLPGGPASQAAVQADGLGHVAADAVDRVEAGGWLLENQGDASSPEVAEPRLLQVEQGNPLETDRAGDQGRWRQETEEGQG